MNNIYRTIKIALAFCLIPFFCESQSVTAAYSGKWKNAATWLAGVEPTASTDVSIGKNVTITINDDVVIRNLVYNCWEASNSTIIGNGHTLTVTEDIRVTGNGNTLNFQNVDLVVGDEFYCSSEAPIINIDNESTVTVDVVSLRSGSPEFHLYGDMLTRELDLVDGNGAFYIEEDADCTVSESIEVSGSQQMYVLGNLTTADVVISGGNSTIEIADGGEMLVTNDLTARGSAELTITGAGHVKVQNDVDFLSANLNMGEESVMSVLGDFTLEYGESVMNGTLAVAGDFLIEWTNNSDPHFRGDGSLVVDGEYYCRTGNTVEGEECFTQLASSFNNRNGWYAYIDPLPVSLTFFKAVPMPNSVNLYWQTASEKNNDYFTIYRSADGDTFEPIGVVAGAGDSYTELNYSYIDYYPVDGVSYYLLKQTDFNGEVSYSEKIIVNNNVSEISCVKVYPNPMNGTQLYVDLGTGSKSAVEVDITSATGKKVFAVSCKSVSGVLPLCPHLVSGVYLVQVVVAGNQISTQKIVVE